MTDVFISYSRKDIAFAHLLHDALKANQLQTWIDWQDIEPAADWLEEVYTAIEAADNFVFIISEHSLNSRVCNLEIERALANHKRLIPIVVQDIHANGIPKPLADINWIAFPNECRDDGDDQKFQRAFKDLQKAITTDQAWVKEHTRLQVRALEWERKGRERSALLSGRELERAEAWLATGSAKEPKPTGLQAEYLLASRREALRRQRLTLGAVAVALVVTAALAVAAWDASRKNADLAVDNEHIAATARSNQALAESNQALAEAASTQAVYQKNVAEEQARIALAGNLSAQSRAALPDSPELALLLAAEAYNTADAYQSRDSLLAALTNYAFIQRTIQTPDDANRVAFSPDGSLLAAGICSGRDDSNHCSQSAVYFFNPHTGQLIGAPVPAHQSALTALAFSPDGRILASSGYDKTIHFWDVATQTETAQPLTGLQISPSTLAFTPDGRWLITGSCYGFHISVGGLCEGGETYVWDWSAGTLVYGPFDAGSHIANSFALGPDGTQVFAGDCAQTGKTAHDAPICEKGGVHVIDLSDGTETVQPLDGMSGITSLALSPDGATLYVSDIDHISSWDTTTWEPKFGRWANRNIFSGIALSPDGTWLAAADSSEKTLTLWDVNKGQLAATIPADFTGFIDHLAFSPDGVTLVSASCRATTPDGYGCAQGDVIVWDVAKRQPALQALARPDYGYWDAAWRTSTADWLAVHAKQNTIEVWDGIGGEPAALLYQETEITDLVLSRSGERMASLGCKRNDTDRPAICQVTEVTLWDMQTRKPLHSKPLEIQRWVLTAEFDDQGDWLAMKGDDNSILLIDVNDGKLSEVTLVGHTNPFYSYVISPDGKTLASAACAETGLEGKCLSGEIRLWSLPDGRPLGEPVEGLINRPASIAFTPDGTALFFTLDENLYRLDLAGRKVEGPILNRVGSSLILSPDGRYLVTSECESTSNSSCGLGVMRIWDLAKQQMLGLPFKGHTSTPQRLVFNPQGTQLLTVGNPGVLVWSVDPTAWREIACQMANRSLTPKEWSIYLEGIEYHPTCPQDRE